MPRPTTTRRARAARRGLEFLYRFACDAENFAECGSDLLNWFYLVADRAKDIELKRRARALGRERARHWRRAHRSVPTGADADDVFHLVFGSDAADRLGVRDPVFTRQLRRAVRQFQVCDYLWFDPAAEPPPVDVPDKCACGIWNERGLKKCPRCRRRLQWLTRYKVWYIALIRTYVAACYSVSLGASYRAALKWLPYIRPYQSSRNPDHPDFYDTVFTVTHVVYTLNDYGRYLLAPAWLPLEFAFLSENMATVIEQDDQEMVGEFLDTLKAFGLTNRHALVRAGTDYLLARQNADGSWGPTETDNIYLNYHATLCAVSGLLDYAWRGTRLSFPRLQPLLERWARE
ncbi:MAG: hypothetical protein ACJ74W_05740 [Pyrinomonadaceae bacterium]